jgi:hypothetical protein
MIIGVVLLSMVAALAAAAVSALMGYGLLTVVGIYMLVGLLGVLSMLMLALMRHQKDPGPVLIHGRA